MPQRVRVLEHVLRQVSQHRSRHDFWALHQRLEEAVDPFDRNEVGCVPALRGLHRESIIRFEGSQHGPSTVLAPSVGWR